ncbi:hypothetical protein AJ88_18505 [Mesorhizobium amorphae CCBAU 01583]|nr:hypothetical protein AJ88_18505 [Mesorhizobium amorphae CCBAU 01583]
MFNRPPSRPAMAMPKPSPSVDSRFSAGTLQSSKMTWRVDCMCQPILCSLAPKERPGASFGTTKVEMPFGPSAPVRAMTT